MPISLRQGDATAVLLPSRGGLLSQLTLAVADRQPCSLLWMPKDFSPLESGWPGGGLPILFPLAGRQFAGEQPLHYELNGQNYHMPLHGFAYALPWTVTEQQESVAELQLKSSAQTHVLYPFDFTLTARYLLAKDSLTVKLNVRNDADEGPMPLALGMHPYFNTPLTPASHVAACTLETSADTKTRVTPAGTAGKSASFPENEAEAAGDLKDPIFQNLILGGGAPTARLLDSKSGLAVDLSWSPRFRYLVLWRQPDQGFQCIEPWMGLPDALHNGEGLHWLAGGQELNLEMTLSLARVSL